MNPLVFQYSNGMGVSTLRVAPSILSANFCHIADSVNQIEASGADWIHIDVMDGHFVPNLTFGPKMVEDIRGITSLPLDVHLMIANPEVSVPWYIRAGADHVTFHQESCVHAHRLVQQIRGSGKKPGISIVPSTPVSLLKPLLPDIDLVLIMSVNPGFGGQGFIPHTLQKIRELHEMRQAAGLRFDIVVDGGIDVNTAPDVVAAGGNVLVSGSAFFKAEDQVGFVQRLKSRQENV